MRLKSELYAKEQNEIIDKIIEILELDEKKSVLLYDIENSDKKDKIMELIPTIRKYFAFNNIKAVGEPKMIKRPWLSIIRQITKSKYTLISSDFRFDGKNGKRIRTKKYYFVEK